MPEKRKEKTHEIDEGELFYAGIGDADEFDYFMHCSMDESALTITGRSRNKGEKKCGSQEENGKRWNNG